MSCYKCESGWCQEHQKVFTDNELGLIKSRSRDIEDVWRCHVTDKPIKLEALIARLEAADALIREYENPVPDRRYRRDLLAAYRKSAGKS